MGPKAEKKGPRFHVLVVAGPRLFRLRDCLEAIDRSVGSTPIQLEVLDLTGAFAHGSLPRSLRGIADDVTIRHVVHLHDALLERARSSRAAFLVVLRGDALVPPHWLHGLWSAVVAQPNRVLVTPLSNACPTDPVFLLPGTNPRIMQELLQRTCSTHHPRPARSLACCFMVHLVRFRRLLQWHGPTHDASSPPESPPWTRPPYELCVAEDVYVFQDMCSAAGWEETWREIVRFWSGPFAQPTRVFDWRAPVWKRALKRQGLLAPAAFRDLPATWREVARRMKKAGAQGDLTEMIRASWHGMRQLMRPRAPSKNRTEPFRASGRRLRVVYLLRDFVAAGGVFSVVQLANELVLQGVEVIVGYVRKSHEVDQWPMLTRPVRFASIRDFLRHCGAFDVAVATHWKTASWVARWMDLNENGVGVYFVQDYEAWFYSPRQSRQRRRVMQSYALLPHKIVKSDWLADQLAQHGHATKKIPLGLNLDLFFAHSKPSGRPPTVISLARPSTPRRGFDFVVETLAALHKRRPDIRLTLFGDDYLSRRHLPFPFRDLGIVADVAELPEVYATADVLFEGSRFQAFGRTALECMACGTACVMTDTGGLHEYARHGENCVMVPYGDVEASVGGILDLIDDGRQRQRLVAEALKTARQFDHRAEARKTKAFFLELLGSERSRSGGTRDRG